MKTICRYPWMPLGVLLLSSSVVAQTDSTDGESYKTYLGNRNQFTIDLPLGWHVIDQSPYSDAGVIAFYSQPIELTPDKDPAIRRQQEQAFMKLLDDMSRGALPTFFMDRYKASKGMSCLGYDASAQKRKLKIFSTADALGKKPKVIGKPEVSNVDFGGCRGIKVSLSADTAYGSTMQMLVYSAAIDGMTYDFALLTDTQYFEQNLSWFERAIASVRLTGANKSASN